MNCRSALLLATLLTACQPEAEPAETYRADAEAAARAITASWVAQPLAALAADGMQGRDNLTAGGKKAREYIIAQLKALGVKPAGAAAGSYEQPFKQGVNVVGLLPGTDPALASEYLVLSAHYDHLGLAGVKGSQCRNKVPKGSTAKNDKVCNGAVDNAAGCAAVLAMVRALKQAGASTRRSLLIVFWDAEEDGLLGSKHFASAEPLVPLARVAAMFSVDALGGQILPGLTPLFALGLEYSDGMRQLVYDNDKYSGHKTHAVSSYFTGSDTGGRSDHLPFRLKSVPIIFFSSGVPPEYHSPADELALVSADKLAVMAQQILLVSADVANAAGRPTFVATPKPHLDDARALVALGEQVLKDPKAAGLDDAMAALLKTLLDRLRDYIKTPPQTDKEWQEYEAFIKYVVKLIYSTSGL